MTPIYVLTRNDFKWNEINSILKNYGLQGFQAHSMSDVVVNNKNNKVTDYIILREETELIRDQAVVNTDNLNHLDMVTHSSRLIVDVVKEGNKENVVITKEVNGFIDLTKKSNANDIYNWDDIFVELETMKSYQEMKKYTNKFSARTKVISEFVESLISFKDKVDLNHNPFNQESVLSFNGEINNLIDENKYISIHKKNDMLKGLMNHVKNEGLFTRSAMNKTQRNYWFPSLNAGLPLVPKKDEIHEVTFMFHDLMHHAMPDLILSGVDNQFTKDAYIIHRMLSEAITIVMSDMMFINELVESGIEYDWTKRKIYPIFEEFKKGGVTPERVKELVWANVQFALLGDVEPLIELSNESVVRPYEEKYSKFFIEDYRWTLNNYESMMQSKNIIKKWYDNVEEFIPRNRKIEHFSNILSSKDDLNYKDKVNLIFEEVWSLLETNMKTVESLDSSVTSKNAFINYMVGQMFVFFKFEMKGVSDEMFGLIKNELRCLKALSPNDVKRIRTFFNTYIEKLNKMNIISNVEKNNFKEMIPLFETFFVFYESQLKFDSVKDVVNNLILEEKYEV